MNSSKNLNKENDIIYILSLLNESTFKCYKCSSSEFHTGKNYVKICKTCKAKTSITKYTLFHNVRFGLIKAFKIAIEYHNSNYSITSVEISKKYKITQKTAWNFLKKVENNKDYIIKLNKYNSTSKEDIQNQIKLKKYLNKLKPIFKMKTDYNLINEIFKN